jgi:diguanylate cyclase (GGDEF)-like protein
MTGRADFLKTVRIFRDLSASELRALDGVLHRHQLNKGEVLFKQGDPGGELFVVESGSVGVTVALSDGTELEIVSFSRGDFFGEMSVFEKAPRSAGCYAKKRCRLLSLRQAALSRLMANQTAGVMKILRQMLLVTLQRMRDAGDFLYETVRWGEEARKRSITDPLTGLYNRRYLDETMADYLQKADAGSQPLAYVMLDLDHFRKINEEYSQDMGDRIIIAASECFRRHLRTGDVAARYGGDEFTFILPGTGREEARKVMEAIRLDVEAMDILEGLGGSIKRVTTSQGIACYPENAGDAKGIREAADAALYQAKEMGRNRVVLAEKNSPKSLPRG